MIIVAITGGNVASKLTSSKVLYKTYIMNHLVYVERVLYKYGNFSQELWEIPIRITCLSSEKPFFISFLSLNFVGRQCWMLITLPQTNKFTVLGVVLFQPCAKQVMKLGGVLCVKWTKEFSCFTRYFSLLSTGWIMLNIIGFIQQFINFSSMYDAKHFLM